jgi:hypothetical protein
MPLRSRAVKLIVVETKDVRVIVETVRLTNETDVALLERVQLVLQLLVARAFLWLRQELQRRVSGQHNEPLEGRVVADEPNTCQAGNFKKNSSN